MDKQLKDKAVEIKGKKYVLVSDRVLYFNEKYEDGFIKTELLSPTDAEMVVVKAIVTPDITQSERYFTGLSQAKWGDGYINKTSALENCETSAVGRALAMMGIGVIESIASADEINKTTYWKEKKDKETAKAKIQSVMDGLPPEPEVENGGYEISRKKAEEIFEEPF